MSPRSPRSPRARPGSEAHLDSLVVGLARFYGFRDYHTNDSRGSAAGFPDRTFVKGPRLIFAELKAKSAEAARKSSAASGGRRTVTVADVEARPEWLRYFDVTNAQAEWLEALAVVARAVRMAADELIPTSRMTPATAAAQAPAVEVYLWRPEDLDAIAGVFAGFDGNLDAGLAFTRQHRPGGPA